MTNHSRILHSFSSQQKNPAVSALIGVILMIALTVVLAAIISAVLFGLISSTSHKSAYIVADAQYTLATGYPSVMLSHLQGDSGHLSGSGAGYPLSIRITSGGSSGTVIPDPAGLIWSPGIRLFIVKTGTGYIVTADPARITGTLQAFPGSEVQVSVIDIANNILVFEKTVGIAGISPNITPSPTITPTPTPIPRGPGFSVSGWIRFTSPPTPTKTDQNWAAVVVDGNADSNRRYHLHHNYNNSKFEFAFRTARMASKGQAASNIQSASGPVENQWYYLAGVYNQTQGKVRLYVNGVESASMTLDTSGIASSPGFYQTGGPSGITFGSGVHVRQLRGDVTGISILDQAMNQPEVQSIYQSGHQ